MKKILIVLTILLSLSLVACSKDNTSTKAMEDGKIALVSKEYDKARDLFKLAVTEDSKNTDAKSLLDLTTDYMDLIAIIETNEFDKADDLISKIEKNNKLDIIKDEFIKTKNSTVENKAKFDKYVKEVESVEKLLNENKIDNAKKDATEKLEEVKGIKSLEDRLNAVITKVDGKIDNAKSEIVKHLGYQTDMEYTGMKLWDNTSFSVAKELNGKTMLSFDQIIENSPAKYMYDIKSKNAYQYSEGSVYLLNKKVNGMYEELYGYQDYLKEQEEITKSKIKISPYKAKELVTNYLLSNYPEYKSNFDDIFGIAEAYDYLLEEYNVYGVPVMDKTNPNFKVSDYFVDAITGEVRLNLTS